MIFLILIPGNIGYWKFRLHRLLSWTPERTVPGYRGSRGCYQEGQLIRVIGTATHHGPSLLPPRRAAPPFVSRGAAAIRDLAAASSLVCRPPEYRGCLLSLFLHMGLSLDRAFNAYYKVPMAN